MFSKNYLKCKYFIDFPLCYKNDDFKVDIDFHLISLNTVIIQFVIRIIYV